MTPEAAVSARVTRACDDCADVAHGGGLGREEGGGRGTGARLVPSSSHRFTCSDVTGSAW